MTISGSIQQMESILSDTYSAIAEMGGTIPENKNLENVAAAIESIPTVTLASDLATLKMKLDAGTASLDFPPNSEVTDTYNGREIKWVIGHYGTATMANGTDKDGVYLFRSTVLPPQKFGDTVYKIYYDDSLVNTYLNTVFLDECSDQLKSVVSEITIPVYSNRTVKAKFWLMSTGELLCQEPSTANGGGVAWDAWKIRTGLESPSGSGNSGRIMQYDGGENASWWTRSINSVAHNSVSRIYINGGLYNYAPIGEMGILPGFFISRE